MAENLVRFQLEKRKDKKTGNVPTKDLPIRLSYILNGERLEYFTGLRIDQADWDELETNPKSKKQVVLETKKELEKLKTKVEDEVTKAKFLGNHITIGDLRDILKGKKSSSAQKKSFFDYFDEYIEHSKLTKAPGTIRAITSSYNHIKDFQKDTGFRLDFSKIDHVFYDKFLEYCFGERDLKNAYTGKLIKDLKAFLNWATDRGYNTNMEFKKKAFKKLSEDIEIIFLTFEELMALYKHDFSKDPQRDAIRDLFCFGCFTGMRLSDILSLAPENVHKDKILFRVEKTEQSNTVPLNTYSKAILEKYNGKSEIKALPGFSEGFINLQLKEIFKDVKLKRKVHLTHFQGANKIKQINPLHDIITFHMSKKTFMTNFLAKGGSLITAMAITGNKDFKTAKRYFKVVDSLKTEEMNKVFG